jgi:hypothetical protein
MRHRWVRNERRALDHTDAVIHGDGVTAIAARLMELRRKARENGQGYALRTAQNAAVVVAGRRASG